MRFIRLCTLCALSAYVPYALYGYSTEYVKLLQVVTGAPLLEITFAAFSINQQSIERRVLYVHTEKLEYYATGTQ